MNEPIYITGHYVTHTATAVKVSNEVYQLKMVNEHYRCGGFAGDPKQSKGLSFIDPAGGPFISVGSIASSYHKDLPNLRIKELGWDGDKMSMRLDSIDDDLDEPLGQACRLDDPECESCQ